MITQVEDSAIIIALNESTKQLNELATQLLGGYGIDVNSHANKIQKLIDNAIKKERVKILESEIEKIKRG